VTVEVPPADAPRAAAPRRRRPWARWYFGALGVVLLGIAALVLLWQRDARRTIQRYQGIQEEEGRRLTASSLGRPPLLEPVEEGTAEEVIREVLDRLQDIWEASPHTTATMHRARFGGDAALDARVAAHPEVKVRLESVLRRRSVAVPRLGSGPSTPILMPTLWLRAFLHTEKRLAANRGDEGEALRAALLLVVSGADLARTGRPFDIAAGRTVEEEGLRLLAGFIHQRALAPEEAREIAHVLDVVEDSRPTLDRILDVERANVRAYLLGPRLEAEPPPEVRHLGSVLFQRAALLRSWDVVEPRLREVSRRAERDPVGARGLRVPTTEEEETYFGSVESRVRVAKMLQRHRGLVRVVRAAVGAAAYRAAKGALPTALADLVPEFLAAVPEDPDDGKPLRWAAGSPHGSARVWGVGENGTDDGGQDPALDDFLPLIPDVVVRVYGA
jgi:hypothetical protein